MKLEKMEWDEQAKDLALKILKKYPKEFKAIGKL
jgi:hypothetical protein